MKGSMSPRTAMFRLGRLVLAAAAALVVLSSSVAATGGGGKRRTHRTGSTPRDFSRSSRTSRSAFNGMCWFMGFLSNGRSTLRAAQHPHDLKLLSQDGL